jgi:hypothetical protein
MDRLILPELGLWDRIVRHSRTFARAARFGF